MIGVDQIQLPLPPQFLPMPHHTIHPPAATTPHHPNAVPADVGQQRTITGGSTKPNNLFQLPDGRVLIGKIHYNPFMMIRKCPPHSTPINMAAVIITTAATTTPLHPRNEAYVKILNNSNTMMNDTGHHNTNSSTSSKNRTSPNNGRIIQSGGAAGTAAVVVAFIVLPPQHWCRPLPYMRKQWRFYPHCRCDRWYWWEAEITEPF